VRTVEPESFDEVLSALDVIVQDLTANRARLDLALQRAEQIREQRLAGWSYTDIAEGADGPLLVELLTKNILVLQTVGHQLRAAEARALRKEGLTTVRIGHLFKVSRQRVTALLRPS
jgi:hypothetical protein